MLEKENLRSWLHLLAIHSYYLILILMLKLELPQVMLPRSKAANAGVRAFHFVPAHVATTLYVLLPVPFRAFISCTILVNSSLSSLSQ